MSQQLAGTRLGVWEYTSTGLPEERRWSWGHSDAWHRRVRKGDRENWRSVMGNKSKLRHSPGQAVVPNHSDRLAAPPTGTFDIRPWAADTAPAVLCLLCGANLLGQCELFLLPD